MDIGRSRDVGNAQVLAKSGMNQIRREDQPPR